MTCLFRLPPKAFHASDLDVNAALRFFAAGNGKEDEKKKGGERGTYTFGKTRIMGVPFVLGKTKKACSGRTTEN